jgi:hypothetical protein
MSLLDEPEALSSKAGANASNGGSLPMTVIAGMPIGPKTAASRPVAEAEAGAGGEDICQLQGIIRSSPVAGKTEGGGVSPVLRVKRALHRNLSLGAQKKMRRMIGSALDLLSSKGRAKSSPEALPDAGPAVRLEAGDLVRVRSLEEIEATLDRWRHLKGCGFLSEMAGYCGTTQRVLKRVERFIDERDYRLKKTSGIVLLEGVMCSGTASTGRCDRACLFFWREEWLDKLE